MIDFVDTRGLKNSGKQLERDPGTVVAHHDLIAVRANANFLRAGLR